MKVSGCFIADGNALDIDIGFIPDHVEAFELTSTAEVLYRFFRCLQEAATTGQYGLVDDGAGVISACADAANGIQSYTGSKVPRVMIPDPITNELVPALVIGDWTTTISSNAAARSATDIGHIVRASAGAHNGYVYECTTDGTGSGTEPTWPTTPGESVTDNSTIWICRKEILCKASGQGFTIGATLSVNSDLWCFIAERHDRVGDMGDAAVSDPITFPNKFP